MGAPSALLAREVRVVSVGVLSVRSGPNAESRRVGVVRDGERVVVLERRGNWLRVQAGGLVGWAYERFLRVVPPEPEPGARGAAGALLGEEGGRAVDPSPAGAGLAPGPLVLRGSVGRGGKNHPEDVERVAARLRELGFSWAPAGQRPSEALYRAIQGFQAITRGARRVTGASALLRPESDGHRWLEAANAPRWRLMPASGPGYENVERADGADDHDWGTSWTVEVIEAAGRRYQEQHRAAHPSAPLLAVNDVSRDQCRNTGDHFGHETGLDIDIRLPRNDGGSGAITWRSAAYDRAAMRAQLRALQAQPSVGTIFFNDRVLIREGLCAGVRGHDDHAHINVEPPARTAR